MKPLVAIVGRPNVGKSMLFNKLCGQRLSIVEDTPGVTRDRLYAQCEWRNRVFDIVDTGGIEPGTDDQILSFMREQAEIAISTATVIVFVCDIKTGMTAADQEVANMLLRSRKPVVLAVNKADQTGRENPDVYEFYNLGLGDPISVSALHGHGTGDLLDACFAYFPPEEEEEEDDDVIKVAVIGKPNVGKSSLVNRILGEERVIVSNVAGTTRDAVDSFFENEKGKYLFIDTAGMRKKSKVDDRIEKFSVLRATMAIERADVCLIMINAEDGVTEQDTKVAGLAHEAGKACIIVVNKWDAIEKDGKTMDKMRQDVMRDLSYMTYAPIVFISALTGQRVDRLFDLINYVNNQAATRISTGMLNTVLADATARVQPPTDKGRRLKIYYMTQTGIRPPHFVCFCNDARLFHFSYQRYLENQIRSTFGLEGTPVRMTIRQKGDKEG
ncbi:ribosome biogenesis GTPase Der [Pseudoflavonifractor phocaeensis]|uniref:ribosome biogenesis GTPase Der n=1 Tax=Pseudoflavonifractor phocaeensis TaxID=1870988 RepID=UPI0022857B99|nr:ribosome biogenesis GTPase Der [Pseudoflavonifractor phocaeensis]MDY3905323.1 ribosome biogenesis GTPase Der [Lawsonibacter sp.]